MNVRALPSRRWATASFTGNDGTVASDLSLLGAHYAHCNGCKGRWFSVRCAIDALDAFVAPRFMTTLVVVAAVAGACTFVL